MALDNFFVIFKGTQWIVRHHGRETGAYASREAALDAAVASATESGAAGREACVLLQENKTVPPEIVWIFGDKDPRGHWSERLRRK